MLNRPSIYALSENSEAAIKLLVKGLWTEGAKERMKEHPEA